MVKSELKRTRQYKRYRDNNFYINIPLSWCTRFNLSPTDLVVLCVVMNATKNATMKAYTGSMKGLCVCCNISLPTARRSLEKLIEKGFVRKEYWTRDGKEWIAYTALSLVAGEMTMEEALERNIATNQAFNNRRREV